ncbi:hypothetical protein EXU48_12625 [Occultella glacieicola]|uniref:Uncharacterized protein n=1 Tax=Occultella glacieicola TaxID=2518684 RepID=A0ABY2E7H4_9MICO|nr:hypothetical protein [Occultella glacieicola]TDE94266.1 hypothetical protein EXU48_12625 [Occultella glacieicola]
MATTVGPLGWMESSDLADGATITVLRGVDGGAVLKAFGAMGTPVPPGTRMQEASGGDLPLPWAVVAAVAGRVLVVEPNGWVGTNPVVLRRASPGGLAVSVYWNVNLLTDVEIAENGAVIGGINDTQPHGADRFRELVAPLGLPGSGVEALGAVAWGLRAQAELVGLSLTQQLWQHLRTQPCAYLLVPPLPEQYGNRHTWHQDVATLTAAAVAADAGLVRELTWQSAGQVAAAAGAGQRAEVVSTLANRALDASADLAARRAFLGAGNEIVLWRMLYAATNPDAPTALLGVLADASFLLDDAAFADLLARVRAHLPS